MARFTLDLARVNFNIFRRGKEYNLRLTQRASTIFSGLLSLLPSNYTSSIQGPQYTIELKAVAVEIARIELALEDIDRDRDFNSTRAEFLYSIIGYLVFLNGRLPPLEFDDEEFRRFLLSLIAIYFQGSVPASMRDAAGLFFDVTDVSVVENFLLTRAGASGFDISDQFGFQVQIDTGGVFPEDALTLQESLRTILDVIRPAHTLFRIRYIFQDTFIPNEDEGGVILDAFRWRMSNYYYEDLRSYWSGIKDRDRLGKKVNCVVTGEDHSNDF